MKVTLVDRIDLREGKEIDVSELEKNGRYDLRFTATLRKIYVCPSREIKLRARVR